MKDLIEPGPSRQPATLPVARRRRPRVSPKTVPLAEEAWSGGSRDGSQIPGVARANYVSHAGAAQLDAPTDWLAARKYAVLVDAGSSGSRMQVYSWKDPKLDRALKESKGQDIKTLPKVEKGTWEGSGMEWTLKVEPGISSFGDHPADVAEYLRPLMDHAEKIVPQSAWSDTPIFIMATAGMRLLPDNQREAVLSEACRYVKEHTAFRIDGGCSAHVSVISGEEEGLLGWISVNYLMDGFHIRGEQTSAQGDTDVVEGKSTFGFLDMGGASTQIAFEPSKAALQQDGQAGAQEELTPVVLRMLDGTEVEHQVFVTTFLGYGTNQARERYIEQVKQTTAPPGPPASSALATVTAPAAMGARPTSSQSRYIDPCLPRGLELAAAGHDHDVSLVGTGSFTKCLEATHPLLDKDAVCAKPPCLFHGVHVPKIDFSVNHFIGVSEYWFSSNDVFNQGGVYDFVSFQKAAVDFCGKPWSELKSHLDAGDLFGPQVELNRLQLQCFKAAWMVTVLHEGIGLPRIVDNKGQGDGKNHTDEAQDKADQKNLFQSVNDVDGFSVSWTLGKAVAQASKDIPPAPRLLPSPFDGVPAHGASAATGLGGWKPFGTTWPTTGENSAFPPALQAGQRALGPIPFLIAIAAFLVLALTCVCTWGRGLRATRRRTAIKELLPPPLGTLGGVFASKKVGRGDYALASMEEGSEVKGFGYSTKKFFRSKRGGSSPSSPDFESEQSFSSEGSSEESGGSGSGRPWAHRRRKSSSGLVRTLMLPARRLFYSVASLLPTSWSSRAMDGAQRASERYQSSRSRRGAGGRIPVRRGATSPTMVKVSRPGSPALGITSGSTISRPASRTGSRAPTPTLGLRSTTSGALPRSINASGMQAPTMRSGLFSASLTRANSSSDLGQTNDGLLAPGGVSATSSAMLSRTPSRVGSPAPHLSPMSEVRPSTLRSHVEDA